MKKEECVDLFDAVVFCRRRKAQDKRCSIERLTTNASYTLLSLSVVYPVGLGMDAWTRLLSIADRQMMKLRKGVCMQRGNEGRKYIIRACTNIHSRVGGKKDIN